MATKKAKDLKKGDEFISGVTNGSIIYLAKCKIDDIHDLVFYDPMEVKKATKESIRKVWYTPLTGKLQGLPQIGRIEENDTILVPNPPSKFTRILKAILS